MASTSMAQGFQNLESELQDAFGRIQQHLRVLRDDCISDTKTAGTGITEGVDVSARKGSFERVDSLGDWLLKDDVMSIPYEEPATLSGDALQLSAEMLGTSAHSHMRLNSHLMELSMRAAESVHALKKERLRMTGVHSTSHVTSPHTSQGGPSTELQRCESILQAGHFQNVGSRS